jgi:hypothetical protein
VIVARLYGNRRAREGLRRSFYDPAQIDAFGIYCAEVDRCYFAPFADFDGQCTVQLRLGPTRNNQKSGIR